MDRCPLFECLTKILLWMGLCCQRKIGRPKGAIQGGLFADQYFGDLEGVLGGAFAQVVGDNPLKKGLADLTKSLKRKLPFALHWILLLIFLKRRSYLF